jgi:hypothetical protein
MPGYNKKWSFGIREVAIDENEATWEIYDYMYRFPDFQSLFDNQPFSVIGEVNGMAALARKKGEEKIFLVSEMETKEIILVASGLKQLVSFLDEVQKMWDAEPAGEIILNVTKENLAKARELLAVFEQENPGADLGYWEYQCFAGLNMGFPLP